MTLANPVKATVGTPGKNLTPYYESSKPVTEQKSILFSKSMQARDWLFLGKERGPGGSVRYKYLMRGSNQITYSYLPLDAYQ
jgi:hypothetical protein